MAKKSWALQSCLWFSSKLASRFSDCRRPEEISGQVSQASPWAGTEKGARSQTWHFSCPLVFHLPTAGVEQSGWAAWAYPCLEGLLVLPHGKAGCMAQSVPKGGVGFGCKWHLAVDPGERWLLDCVLRSYLRVGKKISSLNSLNCTPLIITASFQEGKCVSL